MVLKRLSMIIMKRKAFFNFNVMTQEEKARKYDDALANARQEYNTTENVERKQWLEELFPELKKVDY